MSKPGPESNQKLVMREMSTLQNLPDGTAIGNKQEESSCRLCHCLVMWQWTSLRFSWPQCLHLCCEGSCSVHLSSPWFCEEHSATSSLVVTVGSVLCILPSFASHLCHSPAECVTLAKFINLSKL